MALTSDGWAMLHQLNRLTAEEDIRRIQTDLQEARDWARARMARLREELAQPGALSQTIELVPCQPASTLPLRIAEISSRLGLPEAEIQSLHRSKNAYADNGDPGDSYKVTARRLSEILRAHATV